MTNNKGFFKILGAPEIKATTIIFLFRILVKGVEIELEVTTRNGKYLFKEEMGTNELEKLSEEEEAELENILRKNA